MGTVKMEDFDSLILVVEPQEASYLPPIYEHKQNAGDAGRDERGDNSPASVAAFFWRTAWPHCFRRLPATFLLLAPEARGIFLRQALAARRANQGIPFDLRLMLADANVNPKTANANASETQHQEGGLELCHHRPPSRGRGRSRCSHIRRALTSWRLSYAAGLAAANPCRWRRRRSKSAVRD